MSYQGRQTTSESYSRAIRFEVKRNEELILNGPKDADGRPMPSQHAQQMAANAKKPSGPQPV